MSEAFSFSVTGRLPGHGRTGVITTPHGQIRTPVFMPVGTNGTVKSLSPQDLESLGAQIILANNYHLYLRPGSKNIKQIGGIHKFMNWPKPVLTDSGGFQVWSLSPKLIPDGVEFKSHIDGSRHFFSPESVIQSQMDIGADIIMPLDVCTRTDNKKQAEKFMHLTHEWLIRCKKAWKSLTTNHLQPTTLFGIIQGALFKDLRRQSAEFVVTRDLPGLALGGEMLENNRINKVGEVMDYIRDLLPQAKPRHALGIGLHPQDLIDGVLAGCDMFDCVAPARLARTGSLYTGQVEFSSTGIPKFISDDPNYRLDISQSRYRLDQDPINADCDCSTCSHFTRAYLHHLFRCKELLYYRLATIHNLRTMIKTIETISLVN